MEGGVEHRQLQRCPSGHQFLWAPQLGRCPYCTLTPEQRMTIQSVGAVPCPPDCCP
jgi:hypothetical protein